MKNYERIKQMSVDELVQFIYDATEENMSACCYCTASASTCTDKCEKGIKQWLLQECDNV